MRSRAFTLLAVLFVAGSAGLGAAEHAVSVPVSTLSHIHGVAFGPADDLVLATHHGVFAVDPAGQARLISEPHDFMGFTRAGPDQLIASGHPSGGGNMGVLSSNDGGAEWFPLADGVGGPVDFHAMSVSPADPEVVYGLFGGIQVSRDAGVTWAISGPAPADTIDLAAGPDDPGTLYAGTMDGLMVSTDFGASWTRSGPEGVPVTAVESTGSGETYAFFAGGGLFRRSDAGLWTALSEDFGQRVILHLAVDADMPNRLAAVTDASAVLISEDAGKSWRPVAQ
ncbi:WD40/YVTN/BNR-like repeat-containing protein [Devosia sp.]|uniref:WD40/YVTN/BNR-like repeat-containing protein n=1 Tax=Devosia sp. TaxID=1871048 RepID=UPI002FCA5A3A